MPSAAQSFWIAHASASANGNAGTPASNDGDNSAVIPGDALVPFNDGYSRPGPDAGGNYAINKVIALSATKAYIEWLDWPVTAATWEPIRKIPRVCIEEHLDTLPFSASGNNEYIDFDEHKSYPNS
ncbi:hypothetical protein Rhopal_006039-T1 [Rhodotorula paludigena]|uniref:Chromo domain-containing protein n=1 Tax=Rhodotorula paludigena TaxID=86838 RepID=A0AAV5GR32_9BASI|nr:hypothetical protein Rhopal_006039-T1 [Rhodotorula paludigena]